MQADLSVSCKDGRVEGAADGSDTGEHDSIKALASVFIVLWPIGVLALYAVLLFKASPHLRAGKVTALTQATAFLHAEYQPAHFYWELVELLRRTTLMGYVLLVPTGEEFFRLLVGSMVQGAAF